MNVYLDGCIYNRPFDNHQLQENIFIEAMAEAGNADYFITCDSDIIKKGKKFHDKLKIKVISILEFFTEVLYVKNIEGN